MALDFEKYAAKGNEFVHLVSEDMGISRDKAGRIINAVLHALRNHLTLEESFQLMAQLPMVLKAVYVDGWVYNKAYIRIKHIDDFLEEVRREDGNRAGYDFGDNEKTRVAVAAIFKALNYFISEGEMNDISDILPKEMKEFIKESIAGHGTIL